MRALHRAPSAYTSRLLQGSSRVVLRLLRIRVTVRGALPREPALIIANHQSWTDIVAILARHRCTFVAKREVREWPVIGWLAERLGVVFVERRRSRDLLRAVAALEDTLRRGTSVVLFAEGSTGTGAGVLPFRSSLVEAALRAGVSVVPLAITATARDNTDALCWVGDESLLHSLPRVAALTDAAIQLHAAAPVFPERSRKWLTAVAREAIVRRTVGGAIRVQAAPVSAALGRAVTAVAS